MKYNFSNLLITDEGVKELHNCHSLDLRSCDRITDEGVKELYSCHSLNLCGCNKITRKIIFESKNKGIIIL